MKAFQDSAMDYEMLEDSVESSLDFQVIISRIREIRRGWSESERTQRAVEGRRRRAELERLLLGQDNRCSINDLADDHGTRNLSLVG